MLRMEVVLIQLTEFISERYIMQHMADLFYSILSHFHAKNAQKKPPNPAKKKDSTIPAIAHSHRIRKCVFE